MTAIQAMMSPLHRHWALYKKKKKKKKQGPGMDQGWIQSLRIVWPGGEELL